jgi:tetratricopeptide (TPR) repeat protein
MSKSKQKAKGKAKRRVGPPKRRKSVSGGRRFDQALHRFHEGDKDDAKKLLLEWEQESDLPIDALSLLMEICHRDHDLTTYARAALALSNRQPEEAEAHLCAAGGCYSTRMPASALLHFKEFIRLAPQHAMADEVRGEIEKLYKGLAEIAPGENVDDADNLRRLAWTEQTLMLLGGGHLREVVRLTTKHIADFPSDTRALNNQAEALYQSGRWEEALNSLDRSIACDDANYYAHANRCRIRFLRGLGELSDRDADLLGQLQPRQASDLTKAAEAFAFRGEDDRVLAAFERLHTEGWQDDSPKDSALLYHFAAVAHCRRGDDHQAKKLWKQSTNHSDSISFAEDNLKDLRNPVSERSGPFYFSLEYWVSADVFEDLAKLREVFAKYDSGESSEKLDRVCKQLVGRHPHLQGLVPALLDRGDRLSQMIATELAARVPTPDTTDALISFIQSSHGSDSIRYQIALDLKQRGHLPDGELEMFVGGKVSRVALLDYKITDEPNVPPSRSPEVERLAGSAYEALQRGDGRAAEKQLRHAVELDCDSPDLWNNLAMSLLMQDRDREANEILVTVAGRWPEYFFGQLALANQLIVGKKLDEALEVLDRLQRQGEFHRTEFSGLCKTFIKYYLARRETRGALGWLEMLESCTPDDINIPSLRRRIESKPRLRDVFRAGTSGW